MASGPVIARTFQRLLAAVFLIAFASLGAQVHALIGSRGLLPAQGFVDAARGAPFSDAPTLFRLAASDGALSIGVFVGGALATVALLGFAPRLCFALLVPLYLSYVVVGRTFFSFQWDNLLLECGFLALFLDPRARAERWRPARPWARLLFLLLLWKLYAESGIAKWQSPLGDWRDGSAMTFYYETAPIPTRLAWFAHALPTWWHHFESWFTLVFELLVPFAVFGPRRARLGALVVLTWFQLVNLATANYGFFVYLALALHVFLLDDRDVQRLRARVVLLCRRAPRLFDAPRRALFRLHRSRRRFGDALERARRSVVRRVRRRQRARLARAAAILVLALYVGASALEGAVHFAGAAPPASTLDAVRDLYAPLRIVNTYHLFGAITRERIEPELQTFDGTTWTAHPLWHKPGPVERAPDFVAPHQPRLDFQLWFYGLSYRRGVPLYVATLLDRMCRDPGAAQTFFADPLPPAPSAVRIAFWRYHFTSPSERRATGAWWTREWITASRPLSCSAGDGAQP